MNKTERVQEALETVVQVKSDADILDTLVERLVAGDEIRGARWIHLVFARLSENIDKLHDYAIDELFKAIQEEHEARESGKLDYEELPF